MLRFFISISARRRSTSASGTCRFSRSRNSPCVTWNRVSLCQSVSSPSNPTTRTGTSRNYPGPGRVGNWRDVKPLNGIHHISAITADATRNLLFYTGVMGMRLVKKTVNQDNPAVYHLFYADEEGSPGADLTFFEYPGLVRGRAGAGMIHRIGFRVGPEEALEFWARRLKAAGLEPTIEDDRLRFEDPEGPGFELIAGTTQDQPLVARHPEIPEKFALQGFAGVRAFEGRRGASHAFLAETLGFQGKGDDPYQSRGVSRGSFYVYDAAPEARGLGGRGGGRPPAPPRPGGG